MEVRQKPSVAEMFMYLVGRERETWLAGKMNQPGNWNDDRFLGHKICAW